LLDLRSCWIVFIHVLRGRPGGFLQFSEGEAVTILQSWHPVFVLEGHPVNFRQQTVDTDEILTEQQTSVVDVPETMWPDEERSDVGRPTRQRAVSDELGDASANELTSSAV